VSEYALQVKDLDIQYYTDAGVVYANNKVTFNLKPKERLGLVGESGSGKSTLALGLMRMIHAPGAIAGGEVWLGETELTGLTEEQMRLMRAKEISMIPQGAMNSLNPVMRVRDQMIDSLVDHQVGLSNTDLLNRVNEALEAVDLDPRVGRMYPHELSGGMKQRVCIATSIVMHPSVIIADEPTSALDVVTQRQVMQTIGRLQEELGSAVILIGHDMGLMAQFTSRMAVMYAGSLVELGSVQDVFSVPLHPYTQMLIDSLPRLGNKGVFKGIPGITPLLRDLPPGCVFNTRCPKAFEPCTVDVPELLEEQTDHRVACHLYTHENVAESENEKVAS
jgi:oligopeptide/dipeptide ABC transporter ATP-binding protein